MPIWMLLFVARIAELIIMPFTDPNMIALFIPILLIIHVLAFASILMNECLLALRTVNKLE